MQERVEKADWPVLPEVISSSPSRLIIFHLSDEYRKARKEEGLTQLQDTTLDTDSCRLIIENFCAGVEIDRGWMKKAIDKAAQNWNGKDLAYDLRREVFEHRLRSAKNSNNSSPYFVSKKYVANARRATSQALGYYI